MELTEKKLRKFFLGAFDQIVMPQLELIHKKLEEHDARFEQIDAKLEGHDSRFEKIDAKLEKYDSRFDRIEKELLDLSEFTIPRINELQENVKFITREVRELARGGGRKRTAQEIRGLEKLISRMKKEVEGVSSRVVKLEQKLKELRQSGQRKTAK